MTSTGTPAGFCYLFIRGTNNFSSTFSTLFDHHNLRISLIFSILEERGRTEQIDKIGAFPLAFCVLNSLAI